MAPIPFDYEELKIRFLKIYDNLALDERIKAIVFLGDEPISWKLARDYVLYNPKKGIEILSQLKNLDII